MKRRITAMGLLVATVCLGLGSAHAQSQRLRQQAAVAAPVVASAAVSPVPQDAIWNAVTGFLRDAFVRAVAPEYATHPSLQADEGAANETLFDI